MIFKPIAEQKKRSRIIVHHTTPLLAPGAIEVNNIKAE
jgi:hypothetical protein